MKDILAASKSGAWQKNPDATLSIAGQTLTADEFELRLELKEGLSGSALPDNTAVVVLDTTIHPELEREGIARDFVRMVQNHRKESKLDVSDRIGLTYKTDDETIAAALTEHKDYIMEQVLALTMEKDEGLASSAHTEELGGGKIIFAITKK